MEGFDAERFARFGYDWAPLDVSRLPRSLVLDGFAHLLALPQEEKDRWTIDREGNGDPDDGYRRKGGEAQKEHGGRPSDRKEYFHVRGDLQDLLVKKGVDIRSWKLWLNACEEMRAVCCETVEGLVHAVSPHLPQADLLRRLNGQPEVRRGVLRLVALQKGASAQNHTDRGGITLHLWASHPGYLLREQPMPPRLGYALAFGGDKLALASGRKEHAVEHRVEVTEEARRERRFAIVYFAHLYVDDLKKQNAA